MPEPYYQNEEQGITIYCGDCLSVMPTLNLTVDMIAVDPPYGVTNCAWDSVIPFEPLWREYKRLLKTNGAAVFTASQPFTTALINSNPQWFRYCWVWEKTIAANFQNAQRMPLKKHEDVIVFSKLSPTFNPQMEVGSAYSDKARRRTIGVLGDLLTDSLGIKAPIDNPGIRHPGSVIAFPNPNNGNYHPTQKPVDLFAYLIRTYTHPGELVLDSCMGSGTTAIACLRTGRKFIGIEMEEKYCRVAKERIERELSQPSMFSPAELERTPATQTTLSLEV